MKYGFDNDKYVKIQSEHIKERIAQFGNKLYFELGGKLFDDYHASRVLPGFKPDSKLTMLQQLSDNAEIVIVISAVDIQKNKVRQDLGITYDVDVLRLREEFMNRGFVVSSVVITHYNGQGSADAYRQKLGRLGIRSSCTTPLRAILIMWNSSTRTRDSAKTIMCRPRVRWSSSQLPDRVAARWRCA